MNPYRGSHDPDDDPRGLVAWGRFYGWGGTLGFTPRDIKEMSLWEFNMTIDGWRQANGAAEEEGASAPSDADFYAAVERYGA